MWFICCQLHKQLAYSELQNGKMSHGLEKLFNCLHKSLMTVLNINYD